MGKITHSQASSERKKWDKIFNGMVKMLKSQQEQLETLVKERKILEDRINVQHEKWVSDIRLYEDHISEMKSDMMAQEMTRLLEAAKSDMVLGLKHREASLLKLKLGHTDDELADFRAWFDFLRQNPKDSKALSVGSKILEGELRRLKLEYNKLSSEKRSEVSTLLSEKDFVWHQYKLMETDLTSKLNSKCAEVDHANEKIVNLLASMEQLQASNNEKDEFIAGLKGKIAEMEASTNEGNDEISRLTQELELLRKYRSAPVTPALNGSTGGARTSNVGGSVWNGIYTVNKELLTKSGSAAVASLSNHCRIGAATLGGKNGSNVVVKKELRDTGKGSRSRSVKRKTVDIITISDTPDTPKLFSSKFKVPKLKDSSTRVR